MTSPKTNYESEKEASSVDISRLADAGFFDFVPADALDAVQLELASNPASHIPYLDSSDALRRFVSADSENLAEGGFAIGIAEAKHVLRARGLEVDVVATVFKQARVHDVYIARPEGWAIVARCETGTR